MMGSLLELVKKTGTNLKMPYEFMIARSFSNPNTRVKEYALARLREVRR